MTSTGVYPLVRRNARKEIKYSPSKPFSHTQKHALSGSVQSSDITGTTLCLAHSWTVQVGRGRIFPKLCHQLHSNRSPSLDSHSSSTFRVIPSASCEDADQWSLRQSYEVSALAADRKGDPDPFSQITLNSSFSVMSNPCLLSFFEQ